MQVKKEGDNLIITIPIAKNGRRSESGKTDVFATSGGNKPTDIKGPDGKTLYVGVNVYTRVKE